VPAAALHRFPMSAPDDLSGLTAALESGAIDAGQIVALWCKTEGNGLRNDWTRAYADLVLRTALARRLGSDADSLRERIPILVSGGSEGVVSPHLIVITGAPAGAPDRIGLVAGTAGGTIPQDAIGTARHGRLAADLVRAAMTQAGLTAATTRLVFVRAPSDPARAGWDTKARAAGALGAAIALDEVADAALTDGAFGVRHDLFCSRAFVVARHDGLLHQVLVLGNAPGGNPAFRIAHGVLADPIDARGVAAILGELGLTAAPQLVPEASRRVVAVMSKGDAPISGAVRGLRHVMAIDNDVAMHRHARAAYGTLLASAIGHTACLVSGGAEHQGPADGGFAAIIARID
jgi:cyanuric acid amidohydrolase